MNRLDSLRLSLYNAKAIFGRLKTDIEEMQRNHGRIRVDFNLGTARGVCLLKFHVVALGKTGKFVDLAETFPPNVQHMVEALLPNIVPLFVGLEDLLAEIHKLEVAVIASATAVAPQPWNIPLPTERQLRLLLDQTTVKLHCYERCVPTCRHVVCSLVRVVLTLCLACREINRAIQDLKPLQLQFGMLRTTVEWKLSKLITGIAMGAPLTLG